MKSFNQGEIGDFESLLGCRLNQFEILEKTGIEATGIIYKARHSMLSQRFLRLKVARSPTSSVSSESHPLEHEAKLIHRVCCSNVIEVHDVAEAGGVVFLVMEWVEGRHLCDVIRHGLRDIYEVLHYAYQIAQTLAEIHTNGIALCGLSDQGILVMEGRSIKMVDFSAAVEIQNAAPHPDTGSAYRSSIETALHQDVQSTGIIIQRLIECCTAPGADSIRASLRRIAHDCMQEGSNDKFRNGSDIVAAIEPLVHRCIGKRRYKVEKRFALGGVVALLLLGGTVLMWRSFTRNALADQHPFVIVRREASGCALDHAVVLKASAYVPTPHPSDILRFYVQRSDETPWLEPGQLRLFVGDGPTCDAKPHNVTKTTAEIDVGNTMQVLDLNVRQYDGKWSVGEEKTFWIGASEHGLNSYRASNLIVIRRAGKP